MADHAHAIKGSAGNLGAHRLHLAARKLENLLVTGADNITLQGALEELETAFIPLRDASLI